MDTNTVMIVAIVVGGLTLSQVVESVTKAWALRRRPRHEND